MENALLLAGGIGVYGVISLVVGMWLGYYFGVKERKAWGYFISIVLIFSAVPCIRIAANFFMNQNT